MVLIVIAGLIVNAKLKDGNLWKRLLALPISVTMDDLKKQGYIDVSQVRDSENPKIAAFLESTSTVYLKNVVDKILPDATDKFLLDEALYFYRSDVAQ